VLSDRKTHLEKLEAELTTQIPLSDTAIYRLESGIGKKQRQAIREDIDRRFEGGRQFVLLATAS